MKKRNILVALLVVFVGLFLTACNSDPEPGLQEIGNAEFATIMANTSESGTLVYIGRPTCRDCRRMESNIEQALQEPPRPMYYFQTAAARYQDEALMLELLEPLGIPGIPIIVHIVNGEVARYMIGVYPVDDIIQFLKE